MIDLTLKISYWVLVVITCIGWGSIGLCWILFGVAWLKGDLTDDTTPADVIEKLWK